ncbi:hypothetical protein FRC12_024425, partial [Ceratobasidium sp. 428]
MPTPPVVSSVPSDSFHEHSLDTVFEFNSVGLPESPTRIDIPWFDKSQYNKIVDADGYTRYVHRTAGRILRKEQTHWEALLEQRRKDHPNEPWYPFASESKWRLGYWLATCKSSQSKIDEFLGMEG